MKISSLLPVFIITCMAACSHHENHRNASEAAAITASNVQSAHRETITTLDQIADHIASASSTPASHSHTPQPTSALLQQQ
ncbi:hypothetical protein [Snodgrassella alvi]|uniref:hypothetical protein n=1 Tax=Snodgrassella alvi TaxID=1196083 RepID=UPI000C1E01DF|nr:hypothetical protein [Snodgrassella alvi]PIT14139.1 hypothetical protein BGI33_08785 [Snodgrassella alvi]PIT16045.1 hypothetical protein BGI34_09845 [Snodgrassella alvi]